MENHILVGKRIDLEKLKEYSLRIPVSLNPLNSSIEINILGEESTWPFKIELIFANSSKTGNSRLIVPFEISKKLTEIHLKATGLFVNQNDHLFIGLRSDKKVNMELSVISE